MMGADFQFREKIPVAILGATGSVGQKFMELLTNHPWFEIVALAASERSAGKPYGEVVNWMSSTPLPKHLQEMVIVPCQPDLPCKIAFSALDSSIAGEVETTFAKAGYTVISNSRNHRMDPDVPLLIPEINPEHLELLNYQSFPKGKIVTNPNCSVIGLTLVLKPLLDKYGIDSISVVTMQAISGAGYPGVASLDIIDNVIPFISGEEDKVESEPLKILGKVQEGKLQYNTFKISAQCNRVAVYDGHTECVSIKFPNGKKPSKAELIQTWREFQGEAQQLKLPMAPSQPVYYFEEQNYPQPRRHRDIDKGMAVSIGRLRDCSLQDYKFTLLSHNTVRGAAGCAILNAELMVRKGYIFW